MEPEETVNTKILWIEELTLNTLENLRPSMRRAAEQESEIRMKIHWKKMKENMRTNEYSQ